MLHISINSYSTPLRRKKKGGGGRYINFDNNHTGSSPVSLVLLAISGAAAPAGSGRGVLPDLRGDLDWGDLSFGRGDLSDTPGDFSVGCGDLSDRRGDLSVRWGDLSDSRGDLSDSRGDTSGSRGDLSDRRGDLSNVLASALRLSAQLKVVHFAWHDLYTDQTLAIALYFLEMKHSWCT